MKDFIVELRQTNSPIEKSSILAAYDSPVFRKILFYTYNSVITYNTTSNIIPQTPVTVPSEQEFGEFERLLTYFKDGALSGNAARDAIKDIQSKQPHNAYLYSLILNRDLHAGVSTKIINKTFKKLIPEFELMLCHSFDEKTMSKIKYPAFAQLKYDAARVAVIANRGSVEYKTRNNRIYHIKNKDLDSAFIKMVHEIGEPLVFDGELVQFNDGVVANRKQCNGVATKFIRNTASITENESAGIFVWDVVTLKEFMEGVSKKKYKDRIEKLKSLNGPKVFCAETTIVNSADEAIMVGERYMQFGQEGAIIKNVDAPWVNKRSYDCLKIKGIREADLKVIGVEEGTNKNVGKLGALICTSADGKVKVNVGTGFSDSQRAEYWASKPIDKIVTVKYNELITSKDSELHSLFLPRFVEIREDKNEADCFEKIKNGV